MNITRTIQQTERPEWVDSFFDGSWREEAHFPFGRRVRDVEEGDYLFIIYRGRVVGRCEITRVDQHDQPVTMQVGTDRNPVEAKTVVWVRFPGEPAGVRNIQREGHRGHRYDDIPEW
jgi:hypothetical protein